MAKPQPVYIAGHQFPRKTDALAFLKVMLNRYKPGQAVSDVDGAFLFEALKRHPEAATKIGSGLKGFEVRSADYGTQCFWILRADGSEERFSYRSCI
ncbi:DCL family protein [Rhizobium cauense]|uniref:DCL family protein n=1 Tax=Rhizobium cauense TaxID=1166683 RepID=UPI001C6EBCC6|nr:DCL family protein [Rhizobium cauense]MBW9113671.1 DCL family protein [Rhizobium cauense]